MAFSGSLKFFSPFDLLESLAKGEKTGLLKVWRGDIKALLFFQGGDIISASKTDVYLPRLLAGSSSSAAGISLPKLQQKLQVQVEDIITDILDWNDGQYTFTTEPAEDAEYTLPEPVPTMSVIYNSLRILDEWEAIKRTITTFEAIPIPLVAGPPPDGLERRKAKIYSLMDGKRTIQDLIDGINISKYDLLGVILDFINEEHVRLVVPEKVRETFSPTDNQRLHDREVFRARLEVAPPQGSQPLKVSPAQLEEIFSRLSEASPEALFSQPSRITANELLEECSKVGMDFTLIRLIQLYLTGLRKGTPEQRREWMPFIETLAESLVLRDKRHHLGEWLTSLANAITSEKDGIVYGLLVQSLVRVEEQLRRVSWGDELRDRVVQLLGQDLSPRSQRSKEEKKRLVEALVSIPSPKIIPILVEVNMSFPEFRDIARRGIVAQRQYAAEPLLEILRLSDSRALRLAAVEALREIGDQVLPYMREVVTDERWFVRRNAAMLMGDVTHAMAANLLGDLLLDAEERVREAAIEAMLNQNRASAERLLARALASEQTPRLKVVLLKSLGKIGRDYTAEFLTTLILSGALPMDDGDDHFLTEVCNTLGEIGSERALEALHRIVQSRRLLNSGTFGLVIAAACNAIGQIGSVTSMDVLRAHNKTPHKAIRAAAEQAYRRLRALHPNA